jgi:hypothetical protein
MNERRGFCAPGRPSTVQIRVPETRTTRSATPSTTFGYGLCLWPKTIDGRAGSGGEPLRARDRPILEHVFVHSPRTPVDEQHAFAVRLEPDLAHQRAQKRWFCEVTVAFVHVSD